MDKNTASLHIFPTTMEENVVAMEKEAFDITTEEESKVSSDKAIAKEMDVASMKKRDTDETDVEKEDDSKRIERMIEDKETATEELEVEPVEKPTAPIQISQEVPDTSTESNSEDGNDDGTNTGTNSASRHFRSNISQPLLTGPANDNYDDRWLLSSQSVNVAVFVRPRLCTQHSDCQDPICLASRIGPLVTPTRTVYPFLPYDFHMSPVIAQGLKQCPQGSNYNIMPTFLQTGQRLGWPASELFMPPTPDVHSVEQNAKRQKHTYRDDVTSAARASESLTSPNGSQPGDVSFPSASVLSSAAYATKIQSLSRSCYPTVTERIENIASPTNSQGSAIDEQSSSESIATPDHQQQDVKAEINEETHTFKKQMSERDKFVELIDILDSSSDSDDDIQVLSSPITHPSQSQ